MTGAANTMAIKEMKVLCIPIPLFIVEP